MSKTLEETASPKAITKTIRLLNIIIIQVVLLNPVEGRSKKITGEYGVSMVLKVQNQIFNMSCVRYVLKVEDKAGKFYIGVFTNINDKEFYFEYPTAQRRNEDWDRIDRELSPSLFLNKELNKG